MTTATEAKAKAIVTTKLLADGTMKVVACAPILKRLWAAAKDCESLAKLPELAEKAKAASEAIDALYAQCDDGK